MKLIYLNFLMIKDQIRNKIIVAPLLDNEAKETAKELGEGTLVP